MSTEMAAGLSELATSLASIKENVKDLATEFTTKTNAGEKISAELTEKTDKALMELGDVTTRIGELEKKAAREPANDNESAAKTLGELVIDSAEYKAGNLTGSSRASIKVGGVEHFTADMNITEIVNGVEKSRYVILAEVPMPRRVHDVRVQFRNMAGQPGGMAAVWLNGKQIVSYEDVTGHHGHRYSFHGFGLYRWPWSPPENTIDAWFEDWFERSFPRPLSTGAPSSKQGSGTA